MGAERQALASLDQALQQAGGAVSACRAALAAHDAAGRPAHADEPAARAARSLAAAAAEAAEAAQLESSARLAADDEARAKLAALGPKLEAQRRSTETWRALAELVGQGGQRSYRVFVQGLALAALVEQANHHLDELAPRYQLRRVPGTDMDLQVLDRDQAGAIRSVASLSGGETFLLSLGLALGLSSLATRTARVESLFVDEGFGTLDPETLDQAMSVLEGLQATGRTVGVISHVPELHERIGVLVKVEKLGAGRSRVRAVRIDEAAGS